MTFRIQPLKGIFRPVTYRYQLQEMEAFTGYKRYITLLVFLSVCVYAISGLFGLGSASLSAEIVGLSDGEYEARKQLFFIGKLLIGLLIPCVFLFLSSLYFWSYVNVDFRKLVIIQMTVFCILLVEKAIFIPLAIFLHIDAVSNPFSLGILAQYITNQEIIIHFLSQITLFQICMIAVTCYYLLHLTDRSKKVVISLVILFFMFCWMISSLFSYIKIGVFF